MLTDVWFWLFAACYLGGGCVTSLWVTEDGRKFPRGRALWQFVIELALWPVVLFAAAIAWLLG